MLYTADFETTTDPNDCRVWACGICAIETESFFYGNSIDWFMSFIERHVEETFYFHNLAFDGVFIINHLFNIGYSHVVNKKELKKKTFSTLISDKGQFYSIEICFAKGRTVKIYDSMKLIPLSVERVAIDFGLGISKLKIDYNEKREKGHLLTPHEVDYLKADVVIMARALKILFENGIDKMTLGSSALSEYKKLIGSKNFAKWFPPPVYDYDIRQSYKGGFTYCDPRTKGKDMKEGIVLDVNSLYPSVMYYSPLPYGEGIQFQGEYVKDKIYNLYIQMFTCQFEIKEGFIPTIQLKQNLSFIPTEYVTSTEGDEVTLCLTSVDLELFFKHYDVYNIEYHSGWKFKSTVGLFKAYIDKWNKVKMESSISGNKSMRALAKLMLNNLYGKFSLNPKVQSKIPFLLDGVVKFKLGEEESRDPIYIPVGTFITSWARHKTISAAQQCYDRFMYADTDSLHLKGLEMPDLEINDIELGKWGHEATFTKARFVRQKTYAEIIEGELNITCAGMPSRCYENVTWDNFKIGSAFGGKLQRATVKGGVVLKETTFKIND